MYPDTNASLARRHADLSAVFALLRSAPEDTARDLLARIRAGADTAEILELAKHVSGALDDSACGGSEEPTVGSAVKDGGKGGA